MSLHASHVTPATGAPPSRRARIADFYQLTKPGITRHVLITTAVGFYMGTVAGGMDWPLFLHTLVGTLLSSSGTLALNHYAERNVDGLMRRTAGRPLPARRLTPEAALLFASATAFAGLGYLALLVNGITALITAATLVSYIFIYTPLKRRSSLNTLVGAVPGALPILAGWTAAGRGIDLPGAILFAIMFLWQIPHFLALAWLYREDYRAGGFVMLSKHDPDGRRTSRQIANYAAMLLPVSLLPSAIGIAGRVYFAGALLLGVAFAAIAFGTLTRRDERWWKRLFLSSIAYLPALFLLMVLDKAG